MILPSFKRLLISDYPTQYSSLINLLSQSLNTAIESLNDAVTNGLTIEDNFDAVVKTVNVTVGATGSPNTTTSFPLTGTGPILGLWVLRAVNVSVPNTYPTGGVTVSWTPTATSIVINNVTGLQPNQTYTLTLVAIR